MYQLTEDPNFIKRLDPEQLIPRGHRDWPTEWLKSNTPLPVPPPYLANTPAHHRAIRDAAWAWMGGVVRDRGYDSIESCCSYYNSSVERYKAEARAMVAWRDAVNQALEALVLNPPASVESWDQVRALLPQPEAFAWPDRVELPLDTGSPVVVL